MIYCHFLNYDTGIPQAGIDRNPGLECSGTVAAGIERNTQTI